MNTFFFQPSLLLAPYIEYYFIIEELSTADADKPEQGLKVFPSPQCEMVFSYGGPVQEQWFGHSSDRSPAFAIGGYATRPVEYLTKDGFGVIMVGFKPWGIQCFLDFEAKEITNTNSDMSLHYGREVLFIEEKLREAESNAERIRIIESFLVGKIRRYQLDQAMVKATELITQSLGTMRVQELAKACYMSRRQFLRRFEASIGINPKTFSRIVRFQQVFSKLMDGEPAPDWSEVAFKANYFDQAHFINEFREFSGYTPEQLKKHLQRSQAGLFFEENIQPEATYGKIYL